MAISTAVADGLTPCDSDADAYVGDVAGHVDDAHIGDIEVSFVALPSLGAEWGLQIIRGRDGYLLRSVQLRRSVWYGAYREVRPGYFERGSDAVQPEPIVHTVSLSPKLASAVEDLVATEIAHADPANARSGFDGEGFYFFAKGQCGSAWSPELATKAARLVDIFENLKIQASLPTRLLQLFWEKRVSIKLIHYTGNLTMPTSQYLVVIVVGLGIIAFGALPLFVASVVMLIPTRLPKRRRFIIFSSALSYGFTCFVALVLLPFFLFGSQVSAQLGVDRHSNGASILDLIVRFSLVVIFAMWVLFSVAVPIYLRRRFWANWVAANENESRPRVV
jgi:hypothetical protein